MVNPEEETYSTIFSSLKHPVRRKILRMLSEKPRNFSKMLEDLEISSSHLTYHLENLGELVSKTEDGKYKLSTFGEAAVTTMNNVEEAPNVATLKHPSAFFVKNWKPLIFVLMIGLVLLVGLSYTQYLSLTKISDENHELLRSNELLWDRYTSTLIPSKLTPPISKSEAIQKALEYGNWNTTTLQGMVVDATLVYSKFELNRVKVYIRNDEVFSEIYTERMYEITEPVSDYSPISDGNITYRYIWEIYVRQFQEYIDNSFSIPPSGIYLVDAATGEIHPNLYSKVW